MQLKSILNRLQKHSAFVYETVRLVEHPRLTLEVRVRPRVGTRATCECRNAGARPRATTRCRRGASTSCPCGTSPSSSSMRCAACPASAAA